MDKLIFISHHNSQKKKLSSLRNELKKNGYTGFLAHEDIEVGQDYMETIEDKLRKCDIFLFVCSKESNQSFFCHQEIGMAYGLKKNIIIVKTDEENPLNFLRNFQAVKNNPESILEAIFKNSPVSDEEKKHLSILNISGFSKEAKKDFFYLSKYTWNDYIWNDFGYETMVDVSLGKEVVATIKVAYIGQEKNVHTLDQLPRYFRSIGNSFFSRLIDSTLTEEKKQSLKILLRDLSTLSKKERKEIFNKNEFLIKNSLYRDQKLDRDENLDKFFDGVLDD